MRGADVLLLPPAGPAVIATVIIPITAGDAIHNDLRNFFIQPQRLRDMKRYLLILPGRVRYKPGNICGAMPSR